MNVFFSEDRKKTNSAISTGSANRFVGKLLFIASICSGVLFTCVSSVFTYPGATALTSTLWAAYSTAAVRVKALMAAFEDA